MRGDPIPGPHILNREAFERYPGAFMRLIRSIEFKERGDNEI